MFRWTLAATSPLPLNTTDKMTAPRMDQIESMNVEPRYTKVK